MAVNPLSYVVKRQYDERLLVKRRIFRERLAQAKNLFRKDLLAHYGCVNAIEFSQEGELLVSGGDDRRVLLWSVPEAIHDKCAPVSMQTNHISNIFCLAFDSTNARIFSGGNDDQVIVHDTRTGHLVVKLPHKKPVYGLSVNPQNDCILSTAGDDGRILIYDIRESNADPVCLAKQKTGFHSVMYNPLRPALLATANSEEGIALWDTRKPKEKVIHYDANAGEVSGISACFNTTGSHLLALRRRLPPVMYQTQHQSAVCQFYHPQYYNSCTMKTCSFAGDSDEYVLSGSDDFNLYMWKVPTDSAEWGTSHVVLHGHRSIVNQVRYNKHNNLIASSGVEKMVKLWSTLPIGKWNGSLLRENSDLQRPVYSHDDYIYLVGHTGQRISHDYSDHSTQEDSRMMAFFDTLIQREIEGWDSPSADNVSSDSDSDTHHLQPHRRLPWENLVRNRKLGEEIGRKIKPNKIAQLIAQKRDRLAKMAHLKSTSSVKRYNSREKRRKRKTLKARPSGSKLPKSNGTARKAGKHKLSGPSQPSTSSRQRPKKYCTRQATRRAAAAVDFPCESSASNNSLDAPSTSTGITGSSTVFRVIEQDSDEEASPRNCADAAGHAPGGNFVNILPTPLNGSHDLYTPTNASRTTTEAASSFDQSHGEEEEEEVNEQDVFSSYATRYVNGGGSARYSDSDSNCEFEITPLKGATRKAVSEIDSGFATGACSSGGGSKRAKPCSSGAGGRFGSSGDECPCENFKKRVKKSRVNVRKQLCADSDSN